MSTHRSLVLAAAFVLSSLAAIPAVEAGLRPGRNARRAKPGFSLLAKTPHPFPRQSTLSHDGMRLYTYGARAIPTYRRQMFSSEKLRYPDIEVPNRNTRRTVSRADERRLRAAARRQLHTERRGQALIEQGHEDEGASLVRTSRAALVSQPLEVAGMVEHEENFGYRYHYDPFGTYVDTTLGRSGPPVGARTVVVVFQRVAGSTELRPVRLDVTGGKAPRTIDLTQAPTWGYFGN